MPKVSKEIVVKVICKPRASAAGPDGIPFSVYRDLLEISGQALYLFILHLSAGNRANKSFNYANLFFFPKDETLLPEKHRPISVSNTDNRLVANVVRACISPAILDILEESQRAFVPGSRPYENVDFFNSRFYTKLAANEDYHIFFHDFRTAYDSVLREFLILILRQIGIPEWVISILETLFKDVVAFPILQGQHPISINMMAGLKQGCPLSPLLFLVVIDPLLAKLREVSQVDSLAFCDDVTAGSHAIKHLASLVPHFVDFNKASG